MMFHSQIQLMAAYNQWMNEKLYAVCKQIPNEERKFDLGAYFKSIHDTLNHILWGDRTWMTRLSSHSFEKRPFAQPLFDDFDQLWAEREKVDDVIIEWAQSITDTDLAGIFQFTSVIDGKTRSAPKWVFVTQMFNHQTHHRGQISTLLHQLGYEFDNTDIPWMPGAVDYL